MLAIKVRDLGRKVHLPMPFPSALVISSMFTDGKAVSVTAAISPSVCLYTTDCPTLRNHGILWNEGEETLKTGPYTINNNFVSVTEVLGDDAVAQLIEKLQNQGFLLPHFHEALVRPASRLNFNIPEGRASCLQRKPGTICLW